jgi:predicted RNA-binding Zn ribbon-like protein
MSAAPGFFWVGNHLALDFVNTLAAGAEGPLELLHSDADLWRWARASPLAERVRPAPRSPARLDPEVPRLRSALHGLFTARIDGRPPPRAELERLNEVLGLPRPPPRLAFSGGRYQRVREPLATNEDLRRALADAAAELIEGESAGRLRRCAGEGCVLLFLDVSKSGQRRWCSMAGCGNRSKARAHYHRQREGP